MSRLDAQHPNITAQPTYHLPTAELQTANRKPQTRKTTKTPKTPKKEINQKNTRLEHMERLKLDILALVPQQVHHHLEVPLARNVLGHDVEVGTVEQDLAEEFDGLPFRYVVGGADESGEGGKKLRGEGG